MASGLTREQNNRYTRFKQLQNFFATNAAKVSSYPPLAAEVAEMNTTIGALESFIPSKKGNSGGVAQTKVELLDTIAELCGNICTRSRAYALKAGATGLAMQVKWTEHTFKYIKNDNVQAEAKKVHDAVQSYISNSEFVPYGVTAGMLTELMGNADAYQTLVGAVKTARSLSTEANAEIEAKLAALSASGKQFELLMRTFKESDLAFYTGFLANNEEPNLGVRHTGLEGMVKAASSGAGIAGAEVKNMGTGRTELSDILGAYSMVKFMPGIYNFEVSAPGYAKQTLMLKISQGRILAHDFVLEGE